MEMHDGRGRALPLRAAVCLLVLALCLGLWLPAAQGAGTTFSDVKPGSWYYDTVTAMAQEGILKGYPDGSFRPDQTISGAEFAAVAARVGGLTESQGQTDHWAAGLLQTALDAGWYDWDELPPTGETYDQPIRRQVAVSLLMQGLLPDRTGDYAGQAGKLSDLSSLDGRYYNRVFAAYACGVAQGDEKGNFHPKGSLTRAEAAAILYRVMEKSCVERFHAESSSFRDVPDGKWYTTYVATLEKAGVIVDSKDGNFRPNDAITRAELASMLAQFANVTGGTTSFSDVPATHWAANYIAAAVRSGWIQGYPDGTFRPEQTIKRAEMTAMVNRALGRDPQSASDLLEGMKTWKDNADPTAWFYLDIQEAANGHTYARKTGGEYWTGLVADVVQ